MNIRQDRADHPTNPATTTGLPAINLVDCHGGDKKMKDPNFPFYTSDFLTGTMFFSDEEVGVYIRLLCVQHQHGGLIDKYVFNEKTEKYPKIKQKFIETEEGFYNERLMIEMGKRIKKSNSLSANALKRWDKVKQKHCICNAKLMPTENENENKNINRNKDIPHDEILKLWADIMPDCSQPKLWTAKRKSHLKARWNEIEKRQTLEYWKGLFEFIRESPFLMGKKTDFMIDLPWLIQSEENFLKVIEGKYHK